MDQIPPHPLKDARILPAQKKWHKGKNPARNRKNIIHSSGGGGFVLVESNPAKVQRWREFRLGTPSDIRRTHTHPPVRARSTDRRNKYASRLRDRNLEIQIWDRFSVLILVLILKQVCFSRGAFDWRSWAHSCQI